MDNSTYMNLETLLNAGWVLCKTGKYYTLSKTKSYGDIKVNEECLGNCIIVATSIHFKK